MRNINVGPVSVVGRVKRTLLVDMQRTRLKLLDNLETMFDMAKGYATSQDVSNKQRQMWIRIMAYIGQVMNSLTKSFDEAQITDDLERLEKMIGEAMAKEESKGTDKRGPEPNSSEET